MKSHLMVSRTPYHWIGRIVLLCLLVCAPALIFGCAGQKSATSVQDQTVVSGRPKPTQPTIAAPEPIPPLALPAPAPLPREPEAATAVPLVAGKEEAETVVTPPVVETPVIELADILFDFDRYAIRSDAEPVLEANAQLLAAHADGKVVIEGHCDERGSADYNLVLGEQRAQAAKRYLQEQGIESSRMQVMTYGKERPLCTQHRDDCWQKNRRAHFVFTRE
jgi:peptidoglycan-associated lipoprotein